MNEPQRKTPDQALMVIASPEMQEKFQQVLPSHIPLDRFTRVTLTAIQKNPDILQCDRQTLYNACVDAANRGLMPDGKEGALVRFNTKEKTPEGERWVAKAQFMPMVEGIIKEMALAGVKAHAVSVYAKDEVEVWNDDDGQHFRHKPVVFGERGDRVGAVAWAKDKEGRTFVEALSVVDIAKIRVRSKQKDKDGNPTGTWKSDPERMEQKSALHRLRKRIAILGADDVVARLRADEEASDIETGEAPPPGSAATVTPITTPTSRPKGLQSVIDHDTQKPDDEVSDDDEGEEVF